MKDVPLHVLMDLRRLLETEHSRSASYRIVIIELTARGIGT